jgi:hypothetical protein
MYVHEFQRVGCQKLWPDDDDDALPWQNDGHACS